MAVHIGDEVRDARSGLQIGIGQITPEAYSIRTPIPMIVPVMPGINYGGGSGRNQQRGDRWPKQFAHGLPEPANRISFQFEVHIPLH